ncbi:hypothetical protein BC834DRAFT_347010 [Gloeopeniophorella convolvens]|nr:hypothetical protein BC834DRAFT_347010 [Gloeopeniophorella convolvens]
MRWVYATRGYQPTGASLASILAASFPYVNCLGRAACSLPWRIRVRSTTRWRITFVATYGCMKLQLTRTVVARPQHQQTSLLDSIALNGSSSMGLQLRALSIHCPTAARRLRHASPGSFDFQFMSKDAPISSPRKSIRFPIRASFRRRPAADDWTGIMPKPP